MMPYKPYVPKTISELWDHLGGMVLNSPTFVDKTGMYPDRGIETEFFELNESLKLLRRQFGEENYAKMVALSDRMRAHFEADPDYTSEDTRLGIECIYAMEDIIKSMRRKRGPDSLPRED